MKYVTALCCPPLAMLLARRPFQALIATTLLLTALTTWSSGIGPVLVAFVMIWACRVAGDHAAEVELAGFLRLFNSTRPQQH